MKLPVKFLNNWIDLYIQELDFADIVYKIGIFLENVMSSLCSREKIAIPSMSYQRQGLSTLNCTKRSSRHTLTLWNRMMLSQLKSYRQGCSLTGRVACHYLQIFQKFDFF